MCVCVCVCVCVCARPRAWVTSGNVNLFIYVFIYLLIQSVIRSFIHSCVAVLKAASHNLFISKIILAVRLLS